jgi:hypothetical protein
MKPHVSKVTALFLICQVFLIITHVPLVRLLAWIVFAGDSEIFTETGAAKLALFNAKRVEVILINYYNQLNGVQRPPLGPEKCGRYADGCMKNICGK